MRTFHDSSSEPGRFWTIEVSGKSYTVTSGQVGTPGRTQTRKFADGAGAQKAAEALIARKLKEGFRETTSTAPPSTREALEEALADDPNDQAALAAYTDLLLEEGDPRAELIQVQRELEDAGRLAGQRKKLQKREKELLEAHQGEWLGELAPHLPGKPSDTVSGYRLVRGMLDFLHVGYLSLELAAVLARAPEMRLVRELAINTTEEPPRRGGKAARRVAGLGCLGRSPFLSNVRILRLGQDSEEDDWMFPLDGVVYHPGIPGVVRQMPRLEELYLWAGDYDVNELFALPTFDRLRVLKVYHVRMRHDLAVLAANPHLGKLTHLLLQPPSLTSQDQAYLNLEGVRALVRSPHLGSLTHLQVRMCGMGDAGCEEIVRSGILKRLEVLDLRCGTVTDAGARVLAACPDTRRLKQLNLEANRLTDDGIDALRKQRVKVLAGPQVGDSEMYFFEVAFE